MRAGMGGQRGHANGSKVDDRLAGSPFPKSGMRGKCGDYRDVIQRNLFSSISGRNLATRFRIMLRMDCVELCRKVILERPILLQN